MWGGTGPRPGSVPRLCMPRAPLSPFTGAPSGLRQEGVSLRTGPHSPRAHDTGPGRAGPHLGPRTPPGTEVEVSVGQAERADHCVSVTYDKQVSEPWPVLGGPPPRAEHHQGRGQSQQPFSTGPGTWPEPAAEVGSPGRGCGSPAHGRARWSPQRTLHPRAGPVPHLPSWTRRCWGEAEEGAPGRPLPSASAGTGGLPSARWRFSLTVCRRARSKGRRSRHRSPVFT